MYSTCLFCHNRLTPIEQRWEAIEDCERMYRSTRARVATDQIGLARVAERLDLIRIGKPLLPEFAAWRYSSRFMRRRAWREPEEIASIADSLFPESVLDAFSRLKRNHAQA